MHCVALCMDWNLFYLPIAGLTNSSQDVQAYMHVCWSNTHTQIMKSMQQVFDLKNHLISKTFVIRQTMECGIDYGCNVVAGHDPIFVDLAHSVHFPDKRKKKEDGTWPLWQFVQLNRGGLLAKSGSCAIKRNAAWMTLGFKDKDCLTVKVHYFQPLPPPQNYL